MKQHLETLYTIQTQIGEVGEGLTCNIIVEAWVVDIQLTDKISRDKSFLETWNSI
jgi:hypothetical protein